MGKIFGLSDLHVSTIMTPFDYTAGLITKTEHLSANLKNYSNEGDSFVFQHSYVQKPINKNVKNLLKLTQRTHAK